MRSKIRYFFLSLRIKTKFMLGMLLIILILSICIGNIIYHVTRELVKENTIELTSELLNQYGDNIQNQAEALRAVAFQASKEIIESDVFLNREVYGDNTELFVNRYLNDIISQHRSSNEYIEAVCITPNDDTYYWWYNDSDSKYNINSDDLEQLFTKLKEQPHNTMWLPTQHQQTIMFISKMISPDTLATHGFIILFINKDYFLTLDDYSIIKNEQIAILKDNGEVLIKDQILGKEKTLQDIGHRSQGVYTIEDKNVYYSAVSTDIKRENWNVISIISEEELLKNINQLRTLIFIVCAVISVVAFIIAYIIAEGVTKNIRLLEKNMKKVENGNFNVRVKPSTYDEVGLLTLRFNYMMKKINELINTAYIERIQKQEAEFEVLKSQINPHFLYNTLGSVKWLSRMEGQEKIEEMVDALIYILRASIKGDKYITINEELYYVTKYIELQKIRFEDRFKVLFNVNDDIKGFYCLQFILQPIVENAIYHGLEISKGNGLIEIKGYKKEDTIVLEVIDNGVGMTEEQHRKIMQRDHTEYSGLNSIGIANVDKRIKMYFGDQYGININSEVGRGTCVYIVLPHIINKDELED